MVSMWPPALPWFHCRFLGATEEQQGLSGNLGSGLSELQRMRMGHGSRSWSCPCILITQREPRQWHEDPFRSDPLVSPLDSLSAFFMVHASPVFISATFSLIPLPLLSSPPNPVACTLKWSPGSWADHTVTTAALAGPALGDSSIFCRGSMLEANPGRGHGVEGSGKLQ